MTTRTWNGSTDNFANAADWSPAGVPVSGDVAVISAGTVTVTGTTLAPNLTVQLSSGSAATQMTLSNAVVQASDTVTLAAGAAQLYLAIDGATTNSGTIGFYQTGSGNDVLQFGDTSTGGASTLTNSGTLSFVNSISLILTTGSNAADGLVNNGAVVMSGAASTPRLVSSNTAISGTGSIQVGPNYRFETTGTIGSGQNIVLSTSNGVGAQLAVDNLPGFAGVVSNFTASDLISLTSPQYNGIGVSSSGGISTITFTNNGSVVGNVRLAGAYSASNLSVQNGIDPNSGFEITQIKTTVPDQVSGGTGTGTGGTGTVLPVYRWFDTKFGTHFFTADANEAASVNANRPDLKAETNDFGAVTSTSTSAEAVYRFFDTVHGTHFFTADLNEKNTVQATRSDLTFEPGETFYEHAAQQTGDIPVYRFFDKVYGTHFYTGDANEYKAITTVGAASYRSDLTYEGVGFYAPSGSFKST